jgi:hypothetical protein
MSRSARWKEDQIREQIYLEHLKPKGTLASGAGLNGTSSPGGNAGALPSANIWQSDPESEEAKPVSLELSLAHIRCETIG